MSAHLPPRAVSQTLQFTRLLFCNASHPMAPIRGPCARLYADARRPARRAIGKCYPAGRPWRDFVRGFKRVCTRRCGSGRAPSSSCADVSGNDQESRPANHRSKADQLRKAQLWVQIRVNQQIRRSLRYRTWRCWISMRRMFALRCSVG
jgi:hypothetical protein